jgi:hypothetical protein
MSPASRCTNEEIQDAIETMRQQLIQDAIALLHALILQYQSSETSYCPLPSVPTHRYQGTPEPGYGAINAHRNECDAMVLGYLVKGAYAQNLYPQPLPPYDSYSFSSVYHGINRLNITTACAKLSGKPEDNHGILETLKKDLMVMWYSMNGLDLDDLNHLLKGK